MITMPTIDMAATGMNITRLRIIAGLSVKDLADIFGFATPQAVYKWQHGVAMPTLDNGLSTLFQTNFFRLFFRYCTGV